MTDGTERKQTGKTSAIISKSKVTPPQKHGKLSTTTTTRPTSTMQQSS
jgi:hypothetical protein